MVLFVRCFKCKLLPLHFGKAFRILIIISPKKRKKWSRFINISTLSLLPAYSISWKTNSCYTFENRDLIFSTFQSLAKRVIGESLGRLAVGRLVTRNFGWWKIEWNCVHNCPFPATYNHRFASYCPCPPASDYFLVVHPALFLRSGIIGPKTGVSWALVDKETSTIDICLNLAKLFQIEFDLPLIEIFNPIYMRKVTRSIIMSGMSNCHFLT